jgi:hypothetical protein
MERKKWQLKKYVQFILYNKNRLKYKRSLSSETEKMHGDGPQKSFDHWFVHIIL